MTYDKNNIFAQILRGDVPCEKLFEDEHALAFRDIMPAADKHILVIPRGEFISFDDFTDKAAPAQVAGFWRAVRQVAREQGLDTDGYRLITNHGADANQTVGHFHVHILGGQNLGCLLASDMHRR